MKTKLSPLQKYKLSLALREAATVLRDLKQKPLSGQKLLEMQMLENAVTALEFFEMH